MKNALPREPQKALFWLLALVLTLFSLIYFKSLLQPFFLAFMIWYLIRELGEQFKLFRIGNWRLPRWLRLTLSSLTIFTAGYWAVNLLVANLEDIISNYSNYQENVNAFITQVGDLMGVYDLNIEFREAMDSIDIRRFLVTLVQSLSSTVGNLVMIVIYVVFMILEETVLSHKLDLIYRNRPDRKREVMTILNQIFSATNQYLSMKTLISLITGLLSYGVLLILKVDYAFLWAFLIFLFNYVPYIGSLVATLLPAFFGVLQYGTFWYFVYVFIGIQVIQNLIGNYLEPMMMGKSLNMSPLVVVLALAFWGSIWGVLGMILSVPITSILIIISAQFDSTRNFAILLSEKGEIESLLPEGELL